MPRYPRPAGRQRPFAGVAGGCHRLLTLPIEMAFAKLNSHLRHIGARTIDALLNATGEICGFFEPRECWNYFRAAGYVSD